MKWWLSLWNLLKMELTRRRALKTLHMGWARSALVPLPGFSNKILTRFGLIYDSNQANQTFLSRHQILIVWQTTCTQAMSRQTWTITRCVVKSKVESIMILCIFPDPTARRQGPLSIDEGARSSIYAALLPPNTDIRGKYIWEDCSVKDWVTFAWGLALATL